MHSLLMFYLGGFSITFLQCFLSNLRLLLLDIRAQFMFGKPSPWFLIDEPILNGLLWPLLPFRQALQMYRYYKRGVRF